MPKETRFKHVLVAFLRIQVVVSVDEGTELVVEAEIEGQTQESGGLGRFAVPLLTCVVTHRQPVCDAVFEDEIHGRSQVGGKQVLGADVRGLHLGQQANSRQDARAIIQLYLCSDGERIDTGKRRYGFTLVVHYEISADAQFHVFEETVAEHGAAERHRVFAFGRGLIADILWSGVTSAPQV